MWSFGNTVLLWRLERGLTQEALALAAKVSRPNLSSIERGEREVNLSTLRSLAEALGTTPGTLVDGVSPYGPALKPSRAGLERVAHAAVTGVQLKDPREKLLCNRLRAVSAPLRGDFSGLRRGGSQASAHAYLQLKAMASPETISSLIARVVEKRGAAL